MNIGCKIKNARIKAELSQEQVAEVLGVSRQTVSHWENGKTYPDIVSVIKMSDLYQISLDHLLKEDENMSDYVDFLNESTNTVKSNNRKEKTVLISVFLAIWAFAIAFFHTLPHGSDAGAYSLVFLWIILPVAIFVFSAIIGKNGYWGKFKWYCAPIFGVMYMLAEYATFSMANMTAFNKFNFPSIGMIPVGALISLLGMGIGVLAEKIKNQK